MKYYLYGKPVSYKKFSDFESNAISRARYLTEGKYRSLKECSVAFDRNLEVFRRANTPNQILVDYAYQRSKHLRSLAEQAEMNELECLAVILRMAVRNKELTSPRYVEDLKKRLKGLKKSKTWSDVIRMYLSFFYDPKKSPVTEYATGYIAGI